MVLQFPTGLHGMNRGNFMKYRVNSLTQGNFFKYTQLFVKVLSNR
jgi:hypothetical protein